jgi:prophage DNA circulation protein
MVQPEKFNMQETFPNQGGSGRVTRDPIGPDGAARPSLKDIVAIEDEVDKSVEAQKAERLAAEAQKVAEFQNSTTGTVIQVLLAITTAMQIVAAITQLILDAYFS